MLDYSFEAARVTFEDNTALEAPAWSSSQWHADKQAAPAAEQALVMEKDHAKAIERANSTGTRHRVHVVAVDNDIS